MAELFVFVNYLDKQVFNKWFKIEGGRNIKIKKKQVEEKDKLKGSFESWS